MYKDERVWQGIETIQSRNFTCGHCGNTVSSEKGFTAWNRNFNMAEPAIYICHSCNMPTYFAYYHQQTPGPRLGGNIEHLPDDICAIYREIQNITSVGGYTAAVLASRKLLMHIAVAHGAEPKKKFIYYVDYLVDKGHTPPNSKRWVDEIRQLGNDANHEIVIMDEGDAKSIIKLIEMLLKFNYEFPAEGDDK